MLGLGQSEYQKSKTLTACSRLVHQLMLRKESKPRTYEEATRGSMLRRRISSAVSTSRVRLSRMTLGRYNQQARRDRRKRQTLGEAPGEAVRGRSGSRLSRLSLYPDMFLLESYWKEIDAADGWKDEAIQIAERQRSQMNKGPPLGPMNE